MPPKPKPTRVRRDGTIVPNEAATAAHGALMDRSAARRDYAIEAELQDIEDGGTTAGRYVRVRKAIEGRFSCSKSEAERAIARAKIHLAERFDAELPGRRAEVCRQLQRIADKQEEAHPVAAVAAIREQAKILGFYAPKKFEVTHGTTPELALQLDAIIAVLNDEELAALRVVMAGIERAKAEGQLVLPAGDGVDDEIEDAELVEPEPPPGEPGGN
jgi:hypothetical protein